MTKSRSYQASPSTSEPWLPTVTKRYRKLQNGQRNGWRIRPNLARTRPQPVRANFGAQMSSKGHQQLQRGLDIANNNFKISLVPGQPRYERTLAAKVTKRQPKVTKWTPKLSTEQTDQISLVPAGPWYERTLVPQFDEQSSQNSVGFFVADWTFRQCVFLLATPLLSFWRRSYVQKRPNSNILCPVLISPGGSWSDC